MSLAVVVAHSGRCIELECGPDTRVEAVQAALVPLSGIEQGDQILMHDGARLDPTRSLVQYNLQGGVSSLPGASPLFLYSRQYMRPGAAAPAVDPVPEIPVEFDTREEDANESERAYILVGAKEEGEGMSSPEEEEEPLPELAPERRRPVLARQRTLAEALLRASESRAAVAQTLMDAMEAQALSVDAACLAVERHYPRVSAVWEDFARSFLERQGSLEESLRRFDADAAFLESSKLHPALIEALSGVAKGTSINKSINTLADLVNLPSLRQLAASQRAALPTLRDRVAVDGAGIYEALQAGVHQLMTAEPPVDTGTLLARVQELQSFIAEQRELVEQIRSDDRRMTEQEEKMLYPSADILVRHAHQTLPRLFALTRLVHDVLEDACTARQALSEEAAAQLRAVAEQQGRMRDLGNRLALYRETLERLAGAVNRLTSLRRAPAAYKQCLAECLRRRTFQERYAQYAATLADKVAAFRDKEAATRTRFRAHVEHYIPLFALEAMGLTAPAPHCQISVPPEPGPPVLGVSHEDVLAFQLPWDTASSQLVLSSSSLRSGRLSTTSTDKESGGAVLAAEATPPTTTGEGVSAGIIPATTAHNLEPETEPPVEATFSPRRQDLPAVLSGSSPFESAKGVPAGVVSLPAPPAITTTTTAMTPPAADTTQTTPSPSALAVENARLRADLAVHVAMLGLQSTVLQQRTVTGPSSDIAASSPRWREALAAKDEVAALLTSQFEEERRGYEARIAELENSLLLAGKRSPSGPDDMTTANATTVVQAGRSVSRATPFASPEVQAQRGAATEDGSGGLQSPRTGSSPTFISSSPGTSLPIRGGFGASSATMTSSSGGLVSSFGPSQAASGSIVRSGPLEHDSSSFKGDSRLGGTSLGAIRSCSSSSSSAPISDEKVLGPSSPSGRPAADQHQANLAGEQMASRQEQDDMSTTSGQHQIGDSGASVLEEEPQQEAASEPFLEGSDVEGIEPVSSSEDEENSSHSASEEAKDPAEEEPSFGQELH